MRTTLAALLLLAATPVQAQNAAAPAPAPAPAVTFIHAGQLLDRPGERPRGATTIVVRDGKIAELRDGFVAPGAGAKLVDLKD